MGGAQPALTTPTTSMLMRRGTVAGTLRSEPKVVRGLEKLEERGAWPKSRRSQKLQAGRGGGF